MSTLPLFVYWHLFLTKSEYYFLINTILIIIKVLHFFVIFIGFLWLHFHFYLKFPFYMSCIIYRSSLIFLQIDSCCQIIHSVAYLFANLPCQLYHILTSHVYVSFWFFLWLLLVLFFSIIFSLWDEFWNSLVSGISLFWFSFPWCWISCNRLIDHFYFFGEMAVQMCYTYVKQILYYWIIGVFYVFCV